METAFIQWLRRRVTTDPRVPLGIGDDAAILEVPPDRQCVVATDMVMDGVDFRLAEHSPASVGRKSLAINLSDLAAMGARPVAAFVAIALPRQHGGELARGLYDGLLALARQYDTLLAGGDTNSWDGPLVVSVTAVGDVPRGRAWLRRGARPGDQILVTGDFGGSLLGKHLDFVPRVREARWLADHAAVRAAIDVSDGLSLDLSRICEESGCGAVIELDAIPISAAARELSARQPERSPLDRALADGEDFELILAVAPDEAERLVGLQPLDVPLARIGEFVPDKGLWRRAEGGLAPLAPRGYEHRFDA
jgi:thiamine-monophosphate kinase